MDWSNEEYVRLYVRDTDDWVCMPWQSRALLPLLMRKMDRAGVFSTKRGPAGVAALVVMPLDVVEAGIAGLIDDGCLAVHARGYVMLNFLEAQEATKSDKLRQKESRRRRRDGSDSDVTFRDDSVTFRDQTSRGVTDCHAESRAVTTCHSPSAPSALLSPSDQNTYTGAKGTDISVPLLTDAMVSALPRAPDWRARKGEVVRAISALHVERFNALREELKSLARPMGVMGGPHVMALQELLETVVDLAAAEADCRHVLAVREAEARDLGHLEYFGATVWKPEQYGRALTRQVKDVGKRAGAAQRSVAVGEPAHYSPRKLGAKP